MKRFDVLRLLSWNDKNSIWFKPVCLITRAFIQSIGFILLTFFVAFPVIICLCIGVVCVTFGVVVGIVYAVAIISVYIIHVDFDDFMYINVVNETNFELYKFVYVLRHSVDYSYPDYIINFIAATCSLLTLFLVIGCVIVVIGLYVWDIRNHHRMKLVVFMMFIIVFIPFLPLVLTAVYGVGRGMFEHMVSLLPEKKKPFIFLDKTLTGSVYNNVIVNGYQIGYYVIYIICIIIPVLVLCCCLRQLRHDITTTYIDIEAGEIYKDEKKV